MKVRKFVIYIIIVLYSIFSAVSQSEVEKQSLLEQSLASGITVYWDSLSFTGLLEKNGHQLTFRPGDPLVLLDNFTIAYTDAPTIENGIITVSKQFMDFAEESFSQKKDGTGFKIGAILIDPGHGGKDPGAQGNFKVNGKNINVQEKKVVLSVGKKLYDKLRSSYPDKKIIMTRSDDKFLTLAERTDIANGVKLSENEAVLYVSIHANASLDSKASGYEVWYLSPGYRRTVLNKNSATEDKTLFPILNSMMEEEFTTESILMSKFIMDGLQAQIGSQTKARGIKAEEWFVVRNANMPSVLIEVGFVTNEKEALNLNSDDYLQKTALGIYNGIQAFVTHFERSRGFIQ